MSNALFDIPVTTIKGEQKTLADFGGKAVLVVNTASKCGFTPQYKELNFGVSFPLFKKVDVNGDDAHPLFVNLKKSAPGLLGSQGIKWNFTKFLLSADGEVIKRFAPTTKPEDLTAEIEALLK